MNVDSSCFKSFLSSECPGGFELNSPLAPHTWYRIGGPADYIIYPSNPDQLARILKKCREFDIATCILGDGANVLVHDNGFRGVVILLKRHINTIRKDRLSVHADAGALLSDLVLFCEQHQLGGLEFLSGIPGTVGGALIMNAGTHDGEIGDRVYAVHVLDAGFEPETISAADISFGYRSAPELQAMIITGCTFRLYPEHESVLREFRLNQLAQRKEKQPLEYPSCGSVFKRPGNHYVGKMVEESGLKGLRHGDAMISDKHGGFIVNIGHATAHDVMVLIEKVKEEIYRRYQIILEPEVRFIGF